MKERVLSWAFGPVDAIRLDWFRRAFALTFLLYMGYRLTDWREWLTAYGYHHDAFTATCFKGLPLPLLPPWLVPVFALAALGSSLALVLGKWVRPMTILAAASAFYAQRVDEMSAFSLNKYYVAIFVLLAFAPTPERLDPDVPRSTRVVSAWPVRIVQVGLCIQYCTAGICKVAHGDWLHQEDVLYSQLVGTYRTEAAAVLLRALPRPAFSILELTALAFELCAPLLFMTKKLRPWALLIGLVFHAIIAITMYNLFYFSAQMVSYYVLFLDARWLRRLRHRVGYGAHSLRRAAFSRG
jgi:hypothetical protein